MRIGSNPLRGQKAETFRHVIFAVITHLPNLIEGYHQRRLEVVKLCLNSMRQNSRTDADVLIWDNGSCEEFRRWVRNEYKPTVFVESANIGKIPARNSIIRMLDGNPLIAISDDDIYYYPNWFFPQFALLYTFPNVASVCGSPLRVMFRWGCEDTIAWARENAVLDIGRFISDEYERDYALSIGRTPEHEKDITQKDIDYRVTYKGYPAYCHSHHMAFMAYRNVLLKAMLNNDDCMGDEKPFDIRMGNLGLRLCTTVRLTRHIGNVVDDELRKEIVIE